MATRTGPCTGAGRDTSTTGVHPPVAALPRATLTTEPLSTHATMAAPLGATAMLGPSEASPSRLERMTGVPQAPLAAGRVAALIAKEVSRRSAQTAIALPALSIAM